MRYSILGFNQEEVIQLQKTIVDEKTGNEKEIRIDVVDLLILRDVADFMNRKGIIKYIINEKTFFSVKYDTIIKDLPILDIKQQALRDRLNKLCEFNLLEKMVVKNQSGSYTAFRIGNEYENLLFNNGYIGENKEEFRTDTKIPVQMYSNTSANVAEYQCNINNNNIKNNSSTNNSSTNIKNKKENILKEKEKEELFEECWVAYRRKGSKKKAKEYWCKLTKEEKEMVMPHVRAYVESRELRFQKDFERYLRDKTFKTIVFNNNNVSYDPTMFEDGKYLPQGFNIWYDEDYKMYCSMDNFYDEKIYDGYTDDNRPDGAMIKLNNARGIVTWNKNERRWILTR